MSATPFEQLANLDRRVHDPARLAILTAFPWIALVLPSLMD